MVKKIAVLIGSMLVMQCFASDIIVIDYLKNLYGPVEFTHQAHIGYVDDCTACHHFSEEPVRCSECHQPIVVYRYEGPKRKTSIGLKGAYHGLCLGCHKDMDGPMGCEDCHEKRRVSQ